MSAPEASDAARAPGTSEPAQDPEPAPGPFGTVVAVASLAVLVGGIAWPQAAEVLLRALLGVVAGGFFLARAHRAELPEDMTHDAYSPFHGHAGGSEPGTTPRVLRTLGREIEAVDDPRRAGRTEIPWSVGRSVAREASRRLAERHGLRLEEPVHHPAIRSLVSEPTWLLLAPAASGSGGPPSTAGIGSVPLSRLETILDDLESL